MTTLTRPNGDHITLRDGQAFKNGVPLPKDEADKVYLEVYGSGALSLLAVIVSIGAPFLVYSWTKKATKSKTKAFLAAAGAYYLVGPTVRNERDYTIWPPLKDEMARTAGVSGRWSLKDGISSIVANIRRGGG